MEHRVLTMWRRRLDWGQPQPRATPTFSWRETSRAGACRGSGRGPPRRRTARSFAARAPPSWSRRSTRAGLKRWAFYAWHRRLWLKARTGARLYTQESTSWKLLIRSDAGTGTDDSRSEIGTGTDDSLFALAHTRVHPGGARVRARGHRSPGASRVTRVLGAVLVGSRLAAGAGADPRGAPRGHPPGLPGRRRVRVQPTRAR